MDGVGAGAIEARVLAATGLVRADGAGWDNRVEAGDAESAAGVVVVVIVCDDSCCSWRC